MKLTIFMCIVLSCLSYFVGFYVSKRDLKIKAGLKHGDKKKSENRKKKVHRKKRRSPSRKTNSNQVTINTTSSHNEKSHKSVTTFVKIEREQAKRSIPRSQKRVLHSEKNGRSLTKSIESSIPASYQNPNSVRQIQISPENTGKKLIDFTRKVTRITQLPKTPEGSQHPTLSPEEAKSILLAGPSIPGQVTARYVNVREGPGLRYDKVDRLMNNHPVKILEYQGHWFHLEFKPGVLGWIRDDLMSITPQKLNADKAHWCEVVDRVNFRYGPSQAFKPIRVLKPGHLLLVEEAPGTGDYCRAQSEKGEIGFLHKDYFKESQKQPSVTGNQPGITRPGIAQQQNSDATKNNKPTFLLTKPDSMEDYRF